MLISGFTIIRNGTKFDFPFIESIQSVLPICDEFIINVGASEDDTRERIIELKNSLSSNESEKIKIIDTVWPLNDSTKRQGGQILADQTNLALDECRGKWCFYLQADEVVHEEDLPMIKTQLAALADSTEVEALVFQWVHFYATYDVIQTSRSSYRREIRVVRNGLGIRSTGDAQSFRHSNGQKLRAALTKARVFHYGWVRPQEIMRQKTAFMDTLYHSNATIEQPATGNNYLYKRFVGLKPFHGTHPKAMQGRVEKAPRFDFSRAPRVFHIKDTWKLVSGCIEQLTGVRLFEFRNYQLIKKLK